MPSKEDDEVNQYHPLTNNVNVLNKRGKSFIVSNLSSGLHPNLQTVRSHVLAGDGGLSSLSNVCSRLLQVTLP